MKLAVRRERDFDEPFRDLAVATGEQQEYLSQASLYFSDYYFAQDQASNPPYLTVHPYYFPSGTLYGRYPKPSEARRHCLMLDDRDDAKIQAALKAMRSIDRARFLSDISSYAHWLSIGGENTLKRDTAKWFKDAGGKSFERSWELYCVEPEQFASRAEEWGVLAFSAFAAEEVVPYYFLPYIWSEFNVGVEAEARLVGLVLEATCRRVPSSAADGGARMRSGPEKQAHALAHSMRPDLRFWRGRQARGGR